MANTIQRSIIALAAVSLSVCGMAQDTKTIAPKAETGKSQDIIIHQKGDDGEKMTIVVDGDKVTINGKPVEEFNNKNVTVLRRSNDVTARSRAGASTYGPGNARAFGDANGATLWGSNKAMLGVITGKADNGAKITDVTKESAAEKAGLQKNDVITKVDTKKIESPEDLIDVMSDHKPNDKVDITYLRDGKENKAVATLQQNKTRSYSFNINPDINLDLPRLRGLEDMNFAFNRKPKIGLQIQDVEEGKGVTVKDVDEDSPASKAGMKEGDVITQVNGKEIAGVEDIRLLVRDIKEGDTVKLSYKRGGKTQTSELKIPKRLRTAEL